MTWELGKEARVTLGYLLWMHSKDTKAGVSDQAWGGARNELGGLDELIQRKLVSENPLNSSRVYATMAGGKFFGETIVNPFEPTEAHKLTAALGAANAEITRLTAALAESEQARKVADGAWSEAMDQIDELMQEIKLLKQDSGIPF